MGSVAPLGANLRMAEIDSTDVPRTPSDPTPEAVLEEMQPCEPYTAGDLTDLFEDVSRWTIQRRLETLHESDAICKKKHADNRVTWWIPADASGPK